MDFNYSGIGPTEQHTAFENRLILIALVCYVTFKAKCKKPETTHYEVLLKLNDIQYIPDDVVITIAKLCDIFSEGCTEFPTFGLKGKDIIREIKNILKTYLPF